MILSEQEIVDLIPEEFAGLNSQAMCIQMAELVVKDIERKLESAVSEISKKEEAPEQYIPVSPELTIKKIAQLARAFGEGSDTPAMEAAGLLVSVLAENPEKVMPLLAGEASLIDIGLRAEHGCLDFYNHKHDIIAVNTLRSSCDLPTKIKFRIDTPYVPIKPRIGQAKIKSMLDDGGEIVRDAVIIRMPDGKEACADMFGRFVWITQPDTASDAES